MSNEIKVKPICGFPGVGKSHVCKLRGWPDSDSSKFSWEPLGVRHPDWPNNYIEHLKGIDGIVMVSTHKEVRDALHANNIPFMLCYPVHRCKDEYLERYRQRGSPETFLTLLDRMWDDWIRELILEDRAVLRRVLDPGEYASDVDWPGLVQMAFGRYTLSQSARGGSA